LYCFNWTNSAAVTVKSGASSSNTGTILGLVRRQTSILQPIVRPVSRVTR
jgi:hypothetical protein